MRLLRALNLNKITAQSGMVFSGNHLNKSPETLRQAFRINWMRPTPPDFQQRLIHVSTS
uniref:Uncharacterized protein n=1 Tax=Candidatus Kentrum sp. FM TaxID=2126340 RepID=A0A450SZ80_9GAMM|nr:MAG: hypothetical protein BECKFM1743C_GA0114222_102476 [Candidatus Kentron sp. FM]